MAEIVPQFMNLRGIGPEYVHPDAEMTVIADDRRFLIVMNRSTTTECTVSVDPSKVDADGLRFRVMSTSVPTRQHRLIGPIRPRLADSTGVLTVGFAGELGVVDVAVIALPA